ncbi:DUF3152 domain-containing protein [Nocardioides sp. OK12]|uniref:DUF3152 domain-containing protein n=1 Tax=Nocardioides sp. OK12 TaxID=2758661 RepID=UPI0021C38F65|nr:DUF3152 domain-containing protein [Nocardioides sp. OK12]
MSSARHRAPRRTPPRSRRRRVVVGLGAAGALVLGAVAMLGPVGAETSVAEETPAPTSVEPTRPAADARAAGAGVGDPLRGRDPLPAPEPEPEPVPHAGPGTFDVAPVEQAPPAGTRTTYTVEVERGLAAAGIDAAQVAETVHAILRDPRSWVRGEPGVLEPTATDPDLRILVATPATTDRLCAPLNTRGELSCRNGGVVALNAVRWVEGALAYDGGLRGYRRYVVNHEVGHALGNGHASCPGAGLPAPVMLQQTVRLDGCVPNAWPYP